MFTLRVRDPFGCRGISCVKLPAAVAFPTDDALLRRLEAQRRTLPPNNMKALWKAVGLQSAAARAPRAAP